MAEIKRTVPTGTGKRNRTQPKAAKSVPQGATPDKLTGDPAERHPDLVKKDPDYEAIRDAREGATRVKSRGTTYLPMPSGFQAQADQGVAMFESYKRRAQFPDMVSPTILGMVGIIHRTEVEIEGLDEGSPLADLWEKATPDGLTLEGLHRRITEEILTTGRVGLFVDMPPQNAEMPYIALYRGEDIVNWSDERDFFVLREQYRIRTGYSWSDANRYRVLTLEDGVYRVLTRTPDEQEAEDLAEVEPTGLGGKKQVEIPLVVAGARDLELEPDEPPLIGVVNACYAIYRLDADYRHQLFMSGQETLVFIGLDVEDIPDHIGSGLALSIPMSGDAKYVGPSGVGINAHKIAIDDERENASAAGARIFDSSTGRGAESGDALRIRARAGTATLVSVAMSSAAALEKALRYAAVYVGQDPDEIVVKPSLDFIDNPLTAQDATALMSLWTGKAISYETFYGLLRRGEMASPERTAEEELELILEESQETLADEAAALGITPEELAKQREGILADPNAPDPLDEDGGEDEDLSGLFSPELLGG